MGRKRARAIKNLQRKFDEKYPISKVKSGRGEGVVPNPHPITQLDKGSAIRQPENSPTMPDLPPDFNIKRKLNFNVKKLRDLFKMRKDVMSREKSVYYDVRPFPEDKEIEVPFFTSSDSTSPKVMNINAMRDAKSSGRLGNESSSIFSKSTVDFPNLKRVSTLKPKDPRRFED